MSGLAGRIKFYDVFRSPKWLLFDSWRNQIVEADATHQGFVIIYFIVVFQALTRQLPIHLWKEAQVWCVVVHLFALSNFRRPLWSVFQMRKMLPWHPAVPFRWMQHSVELVWLKVTSVRSYIIIIWINHWVVIELHLETQLIGFLKIQVIIDIVATAAARLTIIQ